MTHEFKSLITRENIPELKDAIYKYTRQFMLAYTTLLLLAAFSVFLVTFIPYNKMPEIGKAINESDIASMTRSIMIVICVTIGVLSLLHVLAYTTVIVILNDISKQGFVDGNSYSLLKTLYKIDKMTKENTRMADLQELILAVWLCMFESYDITVKPGCLPQGKTEFTACNEQHVYTETFMLPINARILEYSLDDNKTKTIALKKRR